MQKVFRTPDNLPEHIWQPAMCFYRLYRFGCDFFLLYFENIFFRNTFNQYYIHCPVSFLSCCIVGLHLCFFQIVLPDFFRCKIHTTLLKNRQLLWYFFNVIVDDFREHFFNFPSKYFAIKPFFFLRKDMALVYFSFVEISPILNFLKYEKYFRAYDVLLCQPCVFF